MLPTWIVREWGHFQRSYNLVCFDSPCLQSYCLVIDILLSLVILGLAYGADRLLKRSQQRFRKWTSRLGLSERLWAEIGISLGWLFLRAGLWSLAILGILTRVAVLSPVATVVLQGLRSLPTQVGQWLSVPTLDLGRTRLSLSTVLTALFAAIAIFIAARLLSQSVKTWVLKRSRIDRGMQEAISAIITYAIAILGLVIVLQTIGIDLSSLTVLAGVLGLGFGLGLQELASNFVSGLALLFEQQLRVGDFVEVEGIFGTIEQISIRSTILRTTDRRFVIVPNHLFFQKNVINWSYQSPETRLHIPIPVAFGSDTVLVTETLLVAARLEPRVLRYPSPTVWFKKFGESSYEFELLVWINDPQNFNDIHSALNFLIEQELNRAGIEIPFPQTELRLHDSLSQRFEPRTESQRTPALDPSILGQVMQEHSGVQSLRSLRVLLKQVSYFAKCSDPQLRMLIEQGYRRFFRQEQVICKEGEAGDSFYILLKGEVEIISEKLNQEIASLKPGDFFGEISLFTGSPRSATVRAKEDTTVFVVDHRALQMLLQNYQELAEQLAEALSQRQQVLRELGILSDDSFSCDIESPLQWIRNRIQTLFGI
jgi:potassium-dependent mechanosensitive channel